MVSGGGTTRDVVLPSLFSVSGSVTAQDFRSVSLLSGPVNATSNEADFQVLVPEGSYLLELRRRILVDGSVTGDLFFEAGSILVEGDLDLGQVTFPDTVDFFSTTLTVLDQTAEGIPNATVSFESTLLEDDPRMRFLGVRRTDENGVIEIDMPAGNYVFQVDLP